MDSPKTTKKNSFSDSKVVKGFLDGIEGPIELKVLERQDESFKKGFEKLNPWDKAKVLEFMRFLEFNNKRKKMLDK